MFTFPQVGGLYGAPPGGNRVCPLASPSTKQKSRMPSNSLSRDRSRYFIREHALSPRRSNRRRHIVIGRTVLYSRIRVSEHRNQRGVDFRVRTPAHRAAVDVVSGNGG